MSSTSGILDTTGTFPEDDDMGDEMALAFAAELEDYSTHSSPTVPNGIYPSLSQLQLSMGVFDGIQHNHGLTDEFVGEFPHSALMEQKLREVFRLQDFRPLQKQALNAAILGHDVFVLMPTGGGKSLIYQLPAILSNGVTFVISPLISLIRDQLFQLRGLGINAATLSGEVTGAEEAAVYKDLLCDSPKLKLVYVCPERLAHSRSKMAYALDCLYSKKLIARFVVDEAHCVAHWGHDFRPDYLKISELRYKYKNIPMMALTATATVKIREEILKQLKMDVNTTKWFLCSFNRPNLRYEVLTEKAFKYSPDAFCNLLQLRDYYDTCGIIYCLSKQECFDVSQALTRNGFSAAPYHAGLSQTLRSSTQDDWLNDKIQIICATIAFGMGIDKPNVRFVIHNTLPKSLEGLYQEAGRAGRDGLPADCIVLYSYDDLRRVEFIIDKSGKKNQTEKDKLHAQQLKDNLYRVKLYCTNSEVCRRVEILKYFGEVFDPMNCGRNTGSLCDVCNRKEGNRKRIKEEVKANATVEPKNLSGVEVAIVPAIGYSTNYLCDPAMPLHHLMQQVTTVQRKCLKELQGYMELHQDVNTVNLTTMVLEVLAVELPDTLERLSALSRIPLYCSTQLGTLLRIIKKFSSQKFELYQSYCVGTSPPPKEMLAQTPVDSMDKNNNENLARITKPGLKTLMPTGVPFLPVPKENTNKVEKCLPRKKPKVETDSCTTIPATSNSDGTIKRRKEANMDLGMFDVVKSNGPDKYNIPRILVTESGADMSDIVSSGGATDGSWVSAESDHTYSVLHAVDTDNYGNLQLQSILNMTQATDTNTAGVFPAAVDHESRTDSSTASSIVRAPQPSSIVPVTRTKGKTNRRTLVSTACTDTVNVVPMDSNEGGPSRSKEPKMDVPEPVPQIQTRRAIRKPKRYSS